VLYLETAVACAAERVNAVCVASAIAVCERYRCASALLVSSTTLLMLRYMLLLPARLKPLRFCCAFLLLYA
jgi:hypothetical protein